MANLLSTTVTGNLLALNNGAAYAYTTASNGRLYFGSSAQTDYSIYTHLEDFNGNYTKLTLDWHTGIKIGASTSYGGIRFYSDAVTNGGSKLFSVGEGDTNVRVENNLYVGNTIYNNGNAVIHTGNIGSQSVSYASSAGDADTLDGYHANAVGNRYFTARGFTVNGDENTYYPVIIPGSGIYAFNRYSIYRWYGWTAPWDPIGTGSHKGGLTFDFEWSGDPAWGGNDHTLRVVQFSEQYTTMVAGLALPVTGGTCVWLRGGGAYYECQVDGYPVTPTVYLEGFTASNGAVYSPRTDTSNVQSEILNRQPVVSSSDLYDGGNRVLHVGGDQTKSGYLQSDSSLRAPIFYDSNDTTYYFNGDSLTSLRTKGSWRADSSDWDGEYAGKIQYHGNWWYFQASTGWVFRRENGVEPFVFTNSGGVNISGSSVTPINITGSQHKYLTINPGNGYEAMVRYIGGSGSGWYVGKRTANTLVAGTESFHFYSEAAGASVGGIDTSGNMITTGSMRAPIFYDSNDTNYYLDPNSASYLSTLRVADAVNGVSLSVGNGSTHGVYTADNARKYLVVAGDYYPHMALVASGSNNTDHGPVFSFVGTEGGSFRQWNIGISNQNPFLFSIGYNRTTDPNPHYGVGDGWSGDDNNHARLSIDRDGNTKIRGMLYVNGTSGGISTGSAVIHAGNIGSQSVSYAGDSGALGGLGVGSFLRDDGWNVTPGQDADTQGTMRSDFTYANNAPYQGELLRFGAGGYSTQINSQYGDGSRISFRTFNNDSAQRWNPWYEFIHSGNIGSQSVSYASSAGNADTVDGYHMNQALLTTSSPSFADGTFGSTSGATDQGIEIRYQNYASGYGRIRFYQSDSNHSSIHSFSNSWQSGSLAGHSTGAINIEGETGVTFGAWNNVDMWIDRSGNAQARGSLRAPIFYDSNDTTFYGDFNSRSVLNSLQLGSGSSDTSNLALDVQGNMAIRGSSGLYFGVTTNNYNSWTTRIYASGSTQYFNGQSFIFDNQGYGSATFATINANGVYAPIFYDSGDNSFYGDFAGYSRMSEIGVTNHYVYNYDYISSGRAAAEFGHVGKYVSTQYASTDYIPFSFESTYGTHSWGQVARFHIQGSGQDRPSIQFSSGSSNTRWNIGYCTGSDDNFRISQNMGYRPDGSGVYDNWGIERFLLDNSGNIYVGGLLQSSSSLRAPIFYDSQDTDYYCDPNGYSNFWGLAIRGDQNSTSGGNQIFFWSSGNTTTSAIGFKAVAGVWADHGATSGGYNTYFTMDTTNRGWIFRRATNGGSDWTGVNVASISNTGHAQFDGSVRSPIFYDSENTNYYLDPNSTGSSLVVAGYTKSKFTYRNNASAGLTGQDNPVKTATGVLATLSGNGGGNEYIIIKTRIPQDSYQMGGFTIDLFAEYYSSNAKTTISLGGYWNSEPNSGFLGWEYNTTNPNVRPSIQVMRDVTDGSTCFAIQVGKNYPVIVARDLYLGYNSSDIEGWLDWSIFGADDLGGYTNNDTVACRNAMPVENWYGNTFIAGDGRFYGTIFYDTNNTSYYLDPNDTSSLYKVNDYGGDTYGYKYFYSNVGSSTYIGAGNEPSLQAFSNDNGPAFMAFHRSGQYAVNFGLDPDNVLRLGGWSASSNRMQLDMSGNVTFAGDVTAYSDARVKENVHTIENALDKTLQLRGVTYNRTDSEDKSTKVGVIAQEVLEVVPEVVNKDASGMYNVSYGNLTAVLIEAIKEQQKQIDELKEIINGLTK